MIYCYLKLKFLRSDTKFDLQGKLAIRYHSFTGI